MALTTTVTNWVSPGFKNIDDASKHFIWNKTNFNMPVPNFIGNTFYINSGSSTTYPFGASTSYNLSGFRPGFEICCGKTLFQWVNNTGSPISFSSVISINWFYPSGSPIFSPFTTTVAATVAAGGGWYGYELFLNIGCKGPDVDTPPQAEVYASGTYSFGGHDSYSGITTTTNVVMNNVPATTPLPTSKEGYVWVEGEKLCYIGKYPWKASMNGIATGSGGHVPGHFWIDLSNILHWIGASGAEYVAGWQVRQFASAFFNGPTNSQTGKTPGFFWVDAEFGQTHISYIGADGTKFLTGDGDYPYN